MAGRRSCYTRGNEQLSETNRLFPVKIQESRESTSGLSAADVGAVGPEVGSRLSV